MRRRSQLSLPTGFAVLAVPESGLFSKDGRITTGKGRSMKAEEIILFKRLADAEEHARQLRTSAWPDADTGEAAWSFPILAVLVKERL